MDWALLIEQVLFIIISVAIGFLVKFLKERGYIQKLEQIKIDDEIKVLASKLAVLAVQQLYKDLDGKEKYDYAVDFVSDYLSKRGIELTDKEIKVLLESSILKAKSELGEHWNK